MGDSYWLDSVAHALAGMCGGVTAVTVFYPLDILRMRLQVADKDDELAKASLVAGLFQILKEEGLIGWYRGLKSSVQCIAASNLVYFFWYNWLKELALKIGNKKSLSVGANLAVGALAGCINVVATNPMWVVNTRLKLQKQQGKQGYTGMLQGLVKLYKEEGVSQGLWSGTGASLLLVSNPSINFMAYERIKKVWIRSRGTPGPLGVFLIGAMAKTVATILTYPLQTVQSRMRAKKGKSEADNTLFAVMLRTLKEEGVLGFFNGLTSKMLQTVSAAALMFLVYEQILHSTHVLVKLIWLRRWKLKSTV